MNSNSTTNSPSGSSDYELVIACVALAVSAIAPVIALFQTLQQYYSSATGYASCKELMIGKWFQFTRRRLLLSEFRFEVELQTPDIFVSAPSNKKGPFGLHSEETSPHAEKQNIPSRLKHFVESKFAKVQLQDEPQEVTCHEITYLVGTEASYRKTHTWSKEKYDQRIRKLEARETRQGIRTAENELATWLVLLMAVQRMEKESRQWQAEKYFGYDTPPITSGTTRRLMSRSRTTLTKLTQNLHTLTVGIQKKKRSWDSMPENMKKPYATSTICHIVEIIAMLGIHCSSIINYPHSDVAKYGPSVRVRACSLSTSLFDLEVTVTEPYK